MKRGDAVLAASKYSPKPLAGKVDVQWRIESLQQPVGRTSSAPAQANQHPEPYVGKAANSLPLTLTGHIERRGDVTVNSGEWLGDPNGTARLEGLQIESNALPQGVEILGACRAGNQTLQAKQNNYLGTKRQATAITQLALCLGGENANNYQLDAEAIFSDGSRHSWVNKRRSEQPPAMGISSLCAYVFTAPTAQLRTAIRQPTQRSHHG